MESSGNKICPCKPSRKPNRIISSFSVQRKMYTTGFTLVCGLLVWLSFAYRWDYPSTKNVYGIMFDAGSTGSRIHVFHFISDNKGKSLQLVTDTFKEIKPGLSAYSADPKKAADSLIPLFSEAGLKIPESSQSSTPIALKATAGLRLLGDATAKNILDKVKTLFGTYPFKMSENNIEIMSGSDEGVYSWMTVNYLLKLLETPEKTIVALDLGGGSTQITFVPSNPETLKNVGEKFKKSVNLFGQSYNLYTHSYLGLGLMSARFRILTEDKGPKHELTSVCLQGQTQTTIVSSGVTYQVRSSPQSSFSSCLDATKKLVTQNVKPIAELASHRIMAFSYFYDRAIDMKLFGSDGGVLTVGTFKKAAIQACSQEDSNSPFLCFDLCYIYTILKDGYVLQDDKNIELVKQINKVEVSWALGAVFDLISKAKTAG